MCLRRHKALLAACLVAGMLAPVSLDAQEAKPAPKKPAVSRSGDVWERLIYLPYKNLKSVFEKQGATVFMPYLEYLKLWEQSSGGMRLGPIKPPVSAVITEANYAAKVEKDLARIEATFTIQVLDKPWAQVPVRFGDAAIGKVSSAGENVLLQGTGNGRYSLLLPTKGVHQVRLELVSRIQTSPDGRSFLLECPPVGITTFELSIPEADQTVEVKPHLVSLPVQAGEQETRIKANLGSTATIAAHWHPRAGIKPQMELLTSVTNQLHVSVDEGLIHTDALLDYEVLRGELSEVEIAVPLGHRILDISVPEAKLKGWKAAVQEKRQVLTVQLLGNVTKHVAVEVHTERPAPDDAFEAAGIDDEQTVHGIHAIGAVRESGRLVVSVGKGLSLSVERQQGLIRVDAADVPKSLRRPDSLYYKFYSAHFRLNVSARPVEPRILAEQQTRLVYHDDELRLQSVLTYKVDRAGIFAISLRLPEELTVDNVVADGMNEFNVDEEARTLSISLTKKRQGTIQATLTAHRSLDGEEKSEPLPLLEPAGVTRETGRVLLYAPEAIEVITDEENVVGAYPEPAANVQQLPNVRLVSAWTYNRRPVEIPVRTVQTPTRLTATVGSAVNVKQELVEVDALLSYTVRHAGIDTFRFAVPEAVADKVQIRNASKGSASAIKQRSRDEEAEEGWVTWTVLMQQEVLGEQRFRVTYDWKPQPDEESQKSDIVFEPPRVLSPDEEAGEEDEELTLSSIEGEIVVSKQRALSVSATAQSDLEMIDVRELKLVPAGGYLAYRYYKQPVKLTIVVAKHEIQPVVETVVSRGLVEIVLSRDPMATFRCRYLLKSSERQRLRVDLPKDADVLGTLLDRTLVHLEKNEDIHADDRWESFFVNVARDKPSDKSFSLTIQYRALVANEPFPKLTTGGRIGVLLPRIGEKQTSQVVLQQLRTAVWVPDEISLVGTPDDFVIETPSRWAGFSFGRNTDTADLDNWIGVEASGIFDFPTEGHVYRYSSLGSADDVLITWSNTSLVSWILSATVLFVGWVLRNTSWENKLSMVLLALFAAALFALSDADWVLHGVAAARFGIVALLAYWLIHAMATHRPRATTPSGGVTGAGPGPAAAVIPPPGVFEMIESKQDRSESSSTTERP